jgi:4-diphosphocytidyl-2-C-methyl-D-erythritol kinase
MRAVAPAKINLALEVLGKREDGFHEIRSVMQTIDIVDDVRLTASDSLRLDVEGAHEASDDDLVLRAVRTMEETHDLPAQGRIQLRKRIPAGAGLGGGSSDAAAAMRLVDRLHALGETNEGLATVAGRFSSDGPFFCYGGTALVSGRGEIVEPLPNVPEFWVVVVTPPHELAKKTRAMYAALRSGDFTDGERTQRSAQGIRNGGRVTAEQLCNAFDRAAYSVFEGLGMYRDALMGAGAEAVHVAGSGPSLFTLAADEGGANAIRGRLDAPDCVVHVARSLSAAESIAIYRE